MRNAPFLGVLGDEALKLLAFGSDPINLKARETLFEAGDPAEHAILVLGGQLRLIAEADHVGPRVYSVGGLIDELALIVPVTRSSTAIAQTSCEVIPLPRAQMTRILNEYPQAAERLRARVSAQTQSFVDDLSALGDKLRS